jgi:hypothetical protein
VQPDFTDPGYPVGLNSNARFEELVQSKSENPKKQVIDFCTDLRLYRKYGK